MINATGTKINPLIVIQLNVVASFTPTVAALRMKNAWTPQAMQMSTARTWCRAP